MTNSAIKVGACQLPEIREDLDESLRWTENYAEKASVQGVRLLCFHECFLQGYLVEDAQARRHPLDLQSDAFDGVLKRLAKLKPTLVFGLIEVNEGVLFNTAAVVEQGRLLGAYRKTHLLDGEKIFQPGNSYPVFETAGLKFGVNICYDTNFPEAAAALAAPGAAVIMCPTNNMMGREKAEKWKDVHNEVCAPRTLETGLWLVSADVTGERDNRISLGPTAIIDPHGKIVAQVPLREVGMMVAEIECSSARLMSPVDRIP